jgi:hypothetical protein
MRGHALDAGSETAGEEVMGALADWKCHKVVKAGKIIDMHRDLGIVIVEDVNGAPLQIDMPDSAFARGFPKTGDYAVIYNDGFKSWSPKAAFEEGYSRL